MEKKLSMDLKIVISNDYYNTEDIGRNKHATNIKCHLARPKKEPGPGGYLGETPPHTAVGELGKNLSPSKRQSYRIRKYIYELASGWKVLFHEKETLMKISW
jgi:hypothetical protein